MKNKFIGAAIVLLSAIAFSSSVEAQQPWLNIYYPGGLKFNQYNLEGNKVNFDEDAAMIIVNESDSLRMSEIEYFKVGKNTPRIDIVTNNPIKEITSKTVYEAGTLTFNGMGIYDDVEASVNIRGRGNSTWAYCPKKPYRLKFEKKQKLGNMRKCKSFALLANWIDESMMRNPAAFFSGQLIGMPYINDVLPVDVYLNGYYKGTYMLTEKVGINSGSVDLSDEDEVNSIMFELDMNSADADEYPFRDSAFGIQIKYSDPDAPEDDEEREAWLKEWRDDFNDFAETVKTAEADSIFEKCDLNSLAKYIFVNNLTVNQELNHPKSVYIWKVRGGKYNFGPCWDFDWCCGYGPTYNPYPSATYKNPLLHKGAGDYRGIGAAFFLPLVQNETFMAEFESVWREFYDEHLDEFWQKYEEYVNLQEPSAAHQGAVNDFNGSTYNKLAKYRENVAKQRAWLENRIEFINSDPNRGLW